MKKSKQACTLVCGLLMATSGLVLAGPRTVELQRRDEPQLRVHLQPAARLAMPSAVKSAVHFQRRAEPELRVHVQPAARLNVSFAAKSAVELQRRAEPQLRVHLQPAARQAVPYQIKTAVGSGEPQRRGGIVPRALSTNDGAVDLRYWVLELRSLFSLLP